MLLFLCTLQLFFFFHLCYNSPGIQAVFAKVETTVRPPLRGHPRDKGKWPLNRGVPLTEVNRYKNDMSVNFAGTKVCAPLKEVSS